MYGELAAATGCYRIYECFGNTLGNNKIHANQSPTISVTALPLLPPLSPFRRLLAVVPPQPRELRAVYRAVLFRSWASNQSQAAILGVHAGVSRIKFALDTPSYKAFLARFHSGPSTRIFPGKFRRSAKPATATKPRGFSTFSANSSAPVPPPRPRARSTPHAAYTG